MIEVKLNGSKAGAIRGGSCSWDGKEYNFLGEIISDVDAAGFKLPRRFSRIGLEVECSLKDSGTWRGRKSWWRRLRKCQRVDLWREIEQEVLRLVEGEAK